MIFVLEGTQVHGPAARWHKQIVANSAVYAQINIISVGVQCSQLTIIAFLATAARQTSWKYRPMNNKLAYFFSIHVVLINYS